MPQITRLALFTVALSLILSLFCLPLGRTTFASRNLHCAPSSDDHSPAYKEGMNALGNNNYEKASEHFKQAAADKPDDMWAFYYFGLCLLRLKRVNEAANAYRQAMAIKPTAAVVHYQLCKIYLEMGDSDAAEKERRWLQKNDRELALYLSDPFPSDKPDTQRLQKAPASSANGELQNIRVVRGLPDGLTYKAIQAAWKIRFNPATRDGKPVSVRGNLEYTFSLF